ncbi:Ger(x)C family spore germination protein [Paenibacillus tuaregi]|uniref:Ger(x)C family spore germination protein n=1 Tax=Paenibacillus tuaregi TaxID=1816681 RepID=UPI000838C152|nr:Ger(x)C family spore germination protein [Paenibacillus tuaregi]
MTRRISKMLIVLLLSACLTGCWDREYLKDLHLAYTAGFDLTEDGMIKETTELIIPPESEQSTTKNEVHSSVGFTPRSASDNLRTKVRGNIRFNKNGFVIIGKPLAQKGISPIMDVNFRDPSNPTSTVRLIITDTNSSDLFEPKMVGELKLGEFINDKIKSLEQMSVFFPAETVDTVFRAMMDPGQDFAVPFLSKEGDNIIAKGVALFHDEYYSGMLDYEKSVMLVLLKGKKGNNARITKRVDTETGQKDRGTITINVGRKRIKRKFDVKVNDKGEVEVDLKLNLQAVVEEYTGGRKLDEPEIKKINQDLSEMLTKDAETVLHEIQKANSDVLGVGRKLIAYHNKEWKTMNWSEDYRKVRFRPQVEVNIVDTGILQ